MRIYKQDGTPVQQKDGVLFVSHSENAWVEAQYWASKTVEERVLAGFALADEALFVGVLRDTKNRVRPAVPNAVDQQG